MVIYPLAINRQYCGDRTIFDRTGDKFHIIIYGILYSIYVLWRYTLCQFNIAEMVHLQLINLFQMVILRFSIAMLDYQRVTIFDQTGD